MRCRSSAFGSALGLRHLGKEVAGYGHKVVRTFGVLDVTQPNGELFALLVGGQDELEVFFDVLVLHVVSEAWSLEVARLLGVFRLLP